MRHEMRIPAWIDSKFAADEEGRIRARLSFMLKITAVLVTGEGTLSELARYCGLNQTTLHLAVSRGYVSSEVAVRIEDAVGRNIITNAMLRRPLEVATYE